MDYHLCGLTIDCNTLRELSNCSNSTECVSGCFCSNDYVLEDGNCIDPAMCPGELYLRRPEEIICSKNSSSFYSDNNYFNMLIIILFMLLIVVSIISEIRIYKFLRHLIKSNV